MNPSSLDILSPVDNQSLQNRAKRVIEPLIPADAEERVSRAFKQWGTKSFASIYAMRLHCGWRTVRAATRFRFVLLLDSKFRWRAVLNDFFAWSGGELPTSDGQILAYLECSYPFEGFDEDEVVEYLRREICTDAQGFSGEENDDSK